MAPLLTSPMEVDVVTASTSQSFKTRKVPARTPSRVSFCNDVRVYRHIHLNDMEESERIDCWYSQDELKTIKAECNRTVRLVARGAISPYEDFVSSSSSTATSTFRGLEFRTPDGASARRANKENAWDKVLDEQESQYLTGNFDDDAIARIYHEVSKHCQEAAHLLGLTDAYASGQRNDDDDEVIYGDRCGVKESPGRHEIRHFRKLAQRGIGLPMQSGALSTVA